MSSSSSVHLPPGTVVFGPKANCTLDICPIELSVYGYRPSLAANATFLALYTIAAIIHTYLGIRWKSWWFLICVVLGCVNAQLGYAARIAMYYNPFNFVAFMIQIICVGSCPVYYCAAIYVTIFFAINFFSREISRFDPKLFYWSFIPCDMISLVLQAAGGALATSSAGTSQLGLDLTITGLAFQVFTMLIFTGCFVDYMIRYLRSTHYSQRRKSTFGYRIKLFFGFISLAIVLILVRCAYRLAELNQGYSGPLDRNQSLFVGFEGVLITVSVYCLMVGHPGYVFKRSRHGTATSAQENVLLANSSVEMSSFTGTERDK